MRMLRYFLQRVGISFLGLTRVGTLGLLLASVLQAASPTKIPEQSSSTYVCLALRTTAAGMLQVSITLSATLVRPRRWLSCALGGEELCSPTASHNTDSLARVQTVRAAKRRGAIDQTSSAPCRRALTVAECHGAPWARATRATHRKHRSKDAAPTLRRYSASTSSPVPRGASSTRRAPVRSRRARREVDLYAARSSETYS